MWSSGVGLQVNGGGATTGRRDDRDIHIRSDALPPLARRAQRVSMQPRIGSRLTQQALHAVFASTPFTAAQAHAAGISRGRLHTAVRSGLVRHVSRWLYAATEVDARQHLLVLQDGLQERGVSAVVGGRSAAEVWGIPVLGRFGPLVPSRPTLWVSDSGVRPGLRGGVHYVAGEVPARHVVTLTDGLRVTSPLRTAIDVVRLGRLPAHLALPSLCGGSRVWLGLEAGLTDPSAHELTDIAQGEDSRRESRRALVLTLEDCPRWGRSAVRSMVPQVDARLETALEALSWGRFADWAVPLPIPQAWLRGASGRWWRVDFWWEDFGIIGEADGMVKYDAPEVLAREKSRQLDLEAPGRSLHRWGWRHALAADDPLMRQVLGRLRRAA